MKKSIQNNRHIINYKFIVTKDDFTNHTVINCVFGYPDGSYNQKGLPMSFIDLGLLINGTHSNIIIYSMNFEYVSGNYYLLFYFSKKNLKMDKQCSIHLLMDNGKVLSLTQEANPVQEVCRFKLSNADMEELETAQFIKWRITNGEGVIIKSGENVCCESGETRDLSYLLFQSFIIDFRTFVRKTLPENELEEDGLDATNTPKPCFVYLMNDTTNNFHKIGISNNPKYREHTLLSSKPTIKLICAKKFPTRAIAEAIESALHRVYANKRIRGEWFNLDFSDIEDLKETLK